MCVTWLSRVRWLGFWVWLWSSYFDKSLRVRFCDRV